jgi:hypothetical protein
MATVVKITSKGREVISGRMKGATPTQVEPLDIGWGVGTATATVFDVGLFKEAAESRVAGTSSFATISSSNDTYQVVGTITSLSAQTISEALLSDSSTKPFSTTWSTAPTTTSGTSGTTAGSYTPANGTHIQTQAGEVMTVSAGSGSTSLTVVRGVNGSTAVTQTAGDTIAEGNIPGEAVANCTAFVHASFTGLALNTNDSIQFTFQVQIQTS